MHQMLRLTAATIALVFASLPTSVTAQIAETQIELTERNIEGFITGQRAVLAILEKMQGATFSDQALAKYRAEREDVIKKHGFKNFKEYEAVAANILIVMAGIDPRTKQFTDPHAAIRQEIETIRADKAIRSSEKKQLLEKLNEALKSTQPIQFPTNIELVRKHYDAIDVTATAAYDGNVPMTSTVVRTTNE